jgi:hypothetical protein
MKTPKTMAAISLLILTLAISGCGPKRPSVGQVDAFMENLIMRMDMTKNAYNTFINSIPEEENMVAASIMPTMFKVMGDQMEENRKFIGEHKTFEADDSTKIRSEALKKAAIDVVDTYIDGTKNEIDEIKKLASRGRTQGDPEIIELLDKFESRLVPKYEAFAKIQKELSKDFGIILY